MLENFTKILSIVSQFLVLSFKEINESGFSLSSLCAIPKQLSADNMCSLNEQIK